MIDLNTAVTISPPMFIALFLFVLFAGALIGVLVVLVWANCAQRRHEKEFREGVLRRIDERSQE
jgi:hypothetical protein